LQTDACLVARPGKGTVCSGRYRDELSAKPTGKKYSITELDTLPTVDPVEHLVLG